MNESKFLSKKSSNTKKGLMTFLNKVLLSILVVLIVLILSKSNSSFKGFIKDKVFNSNFSFATINKWYKEKFGDILPVDSLVKEKDVSVFEERIKYDNASIYKDGVKLTVSDNYLVPVIESGVVIFIGEKENYGNTIIVQQVNGVDVWYSNINTGDIKMYDYLEKGKLLGEAKDKFIYLVFQKDGEYLNYKDFI